MSRLRWPRVTYTWFNNSIRDKKILYYIGAIEKYNAKRNRRIWNEVH